LTPFELSGIDALREYKAPWVTSLASLKLAVVHENFLCSKSPLSNGLSWLELHLAALVVQTGAALVVDVAEVDVVVGH
jgi:hypothetical protein